MRPGDPHIWAVPAGVAIPVSRLQVSQRSALWLRDYQENETLIAQGEAYLEQILEQDFFLAEIYKSEEVQARLRIEHDLMVQHFECAGGRV